MHTLNYRDSRVERHSNIYKPLGISDAYNCLVISGDEFEFNLFLYNSICVAKRLINSSGQHLCPSTLLYLNSEWRTKYILHITGVSNSYSRKNQKI